MPEPRGPIPECSRCEGSGLIWVIFYNEIALDDCPCTTYAREPDPSQSADHDRRNW